MLRGDVLGSRVQGSRLGRSGVKGLRFPLKVWGLRMLGL